MGSAPQWSKIMENPKPIALTGDRTTGPLHLGHYAGSLRKRVEIQDNHQLFVMLADTQALTDNARNPHILKANVIEVLADYLAAGLEPEKTTIFLQSAVSSIARLSLLYLNLVNVGRLERNPTVREEIVQKGMGKEIPAGFLCYPVAQAADITAFKATVVPVGEDQLPMIEISNEISKRVNHISGKDILPECHALLSETGRLPGIDGKAKASKSLGNAIPLGADEETLKKLVMSMYTDPGHLKVSDPGKIEGNVVFAYLDAFNPDKQETADLKAHYKRGGLGDVVLKRRLFEILNDQMHPIRERRRDLIERPDFLLDILKTGTRKATQVADRNAAEIEEGLGVFQMRVEK